MTKIWFKRKTYGWGWVPVTWEGWLVVLGYVGIIVWQIEKADQLSYSRSAIHFVLPLIIATALLISLCYWKGEKPKWMWGPVENSGDALTKNRSAQSASPESSTGWKEEKDENKN